MIFLSGLISMCITAVPLLILLFLQHQENLNLSATLNTYEDVNRTYVDTEVYLLSENVSAGEQITMDVLASCQIKIPTHTSVHYAKTKGQIIGTYAKTELKKGTILTYDMLFTDGDFLTKNRRVDLTDLKLPSELSSSDLIEVRISFPNGEDFVVLKHQKIQNFLQNEENIYGITLALSEEELLRLSSARVDMSLYDGASLYAVIYQADYESAAAVDYPVNPDVFSLMQWDPNITNLSATPTESEHRMLLEERLHSFAQREEAGHSSGIVLNETYHMSQT